MKNRLSHSQTSKLMQCPESYNLHYNKRIRSKSSHSALMFGTALDKATGVLMNPKEDIRTPEEVFLAFWTNQEVNGVDKYLPTLTSLGYAKGEWDEELLDKKDWSLLLLEHGKDSETIQKTIDVRNKMGYDTLTENEKVVTNHAFWLCLKQKGLLMIDAFRKKVMPRLKTVLATQKYISLENEDGDSVIGYIDLIADVEGHGIVVLDVKTSARAYDEETSVIYSPQLSLYLHAVSEEYNTRKAGFIVLNKQVMKNRKKICKTCSYNGSGGRAKTCDQETMQSVTNKKGVTEEKLTRCGGEWDESIDPQIFVQFLVEEIPMKTEELVLENIDSINNIIKTGNYTKTLGSCLNSFGRPCIYLKYCYEGKMDDLEIIEK
jgi:hypothetical protein